MKGKTPKQIIIDILDIIGYENDKDKYAENFLSVCFGQAISNLTSTLSPEKQTEFKEKIVALKSEPELYNTLIEYFPKQEYEKAIQDASKATLGDYISSITPMLTLEQNNKLEQYLVKDFSTTSVS